MIKIVFLCNWGESPKQLLDRYKRQTPNNSGFWNNIKGVEDINKADYYIVLEGYHKILPNENTIFVKREPNFINNYKSNYENVIDWNETNCGITWWINKSYDELKNLKYPIKKSEISCIVSSKHHHREKYVKSLLKQNLNIDLYGRGHNKNYYGSRYKGELNYDGNCKLKGLLDYKYSIVLENSQQNNYFTEKLADSYLSWSVPIYWGCPNIDQYFPENSYYEIDISKTNSEQIKEIIKKPIDIESLRKSRDLILDRYNIWEVINNKINMLKK